MFERLGVSPPYKTNEHNTITSVPDPRSRSTGRETRLKRGEESSALNFENYVPFAYLSTYVSTSRREPVKQEVNEPPSRRENCLSRGGGRSRWTEVYIGKPRVENRGREGKWAWFIYLYGRRCGGTCFPPRSIILYTREGGGWLWNFYSIRGTWGGMVFLAEFRYYSWTKTRFELDRFWKNFFGGEERYGMDEFYK